MLVREILAAVTIVLILIVLVRVVRKSEEELRQACPTTIHQSFLGADSMPIANGRDIGFSSVGPTDRNIVGVDSLHNGLMNMSRQ